MPNPTFTPSTPPPPGPSLDTYQITDSLQVWIDLYLIDLDVGAEFTFQCPTGDVVTLSGVGFPEIVLSTTVPTTQTSGGKTVAATATPVGANTTIVVPITAGAASPGYWRLKATAAALPHSCTITEGSNAAIVRILADPRVVPPVPATYKEKASITLSGTVAYSQVVAAAPPPGLPALPVLAAKWDQSPGPTTASPGATTLLGGPPTYSASAPLTAPAVYAAVALQYELTAWYDVDGDGMPGAGEPANKGSVALTIQARNLHMIVLLDRSGSMSSSIAPSLSRWEGARRAAHVWADLYAAFRTGVAADQVGVMIFEDGATCGWGAAASPIDVINPAAGTVVATLGNIASLDQFSFNVGAPGGCTPIGDALFKAMQKFPAPAGDGTNDRYVLVLLTDGYENSGAVVVEDDTPVPAGAATNFTTKRLTLPGINSRMTLYTIGVGDYVQQSVLDDLPIVPPPGGLVTPGLYRLITKAEDLLGAFAQMLGHAVDAQPIVPVAGAEANTLVFPVTANENRLAVVLQWDDSTDDLRLFHRPQAGGAWTQVCGGGLAPPPGVRLSSRERHGIASVNLPTLFGGPAAATEWKIEYRHPAAAANPVAIAPAKLLVMVDLFLKVDLEFDKPRYATEEPLRLTARIRAGARRVKGATVTVELARPGEGLGTFLAQNGINYKPSPPQGADPNAPKAAMLAALLGRRDMPGLPIINPAAIFADGTNQLFDDGAHEDGPANDGDYANVFTDTSKEGTYTWRVFARGTLPDGSVFNRLITVSKWVGVNVDPLSSPLTTQFGLATTVSGVMAGVVTVKPVSRKGELLGPFRGSLIDFKTTAGTWSEPLQGHFDGTYSRTLHYRRGEVPEVTVVVQGKPFTPVVLAEGCLGHLFTLIRSLFEWVLRLVRS